MNLATKIFTTILFLIAVNSVFGQDNLPNLKGLLSENELRIKDKWDIKEANNEFDILFSGMFVFYKSFLSSQDNAQCNFHPSCSVFAIKSIEQKGAFFGTLGAFDRLTRCNGFNEKDYKIRNDNFLLDDPVF